MKIDLAKKFKHLRKAPVVEAVIELRARPAGTWDEATIGPRLKEVMRDKYPAAQAMQLFSFSMPIAVNTVAQPLSPTAVAEHSSEWGGLRFKNPDSTQIAVFKRDSYSFSRLPPYTRWSAVVSEALRLWKTYSDLSGATRIERIGVRFINRLDVPTQGLKFEDYFSGFGSVPGDLPLSNFVSHQSIEVPGHPYAVVLIRTVQSPLAPDAKTIGLITDIDVAMPQPIPNDRRIITQRLAEMRFLKNMVFFGSVTKKYLARCT